MTESSHGVVKFSALGGNFYIDSETNQYAPPNAADVASDTMYE